MFKKKVIKKEEKKLIKEPIKEESFFKIDVGAEIPKLPDIEDKTKIDVKYPLIPPYCYAHIKWDAPNNELVYYIEEPELTNREKKILEVLEEGVKELINLSFISVKEKTTVVLYLEKNIKVLLNELSINITSETFLKLMYYIYRDYVGLNELEPLMNDYYIEDVECNGVNTPIYVVHRKYRNIRTNLIYPSIEKLTSFVEKLAQKCGKYISYASPLLDGALPDGSRVQSVYTQEVASRGPSYTVRKFTRTPWSPIQLIQKGTASPEIYAYLWMLMEYERSLMVIGATGTGKTSFLNAMAFFIPPQARIVSIEDSVTGDTKILVRINGKIKKVKIEDIEYSKDLEILTLNHEYKIKFIKPKKLIKHETDKDIYEIITATGRNVKVTEDHSIFTFENDNITGIKPTELNKGSFIAVPRRLSYDCNEIKEINLIEYLDSFRNDFIYGISLLKLFKKFNYRNLKINKSTYGWYKRQKIIPIKIFNKIYEKIGFTREELEGMYLKTKNKTKIPLIFKINNNFLILLGLWLGDGCYDNYNCNRIIISNCDKECINIVKKVSEELKLNISKMSDDCSLTINSNLLYQFMKRVLKFDGHSNTKKIPEFVYNLSNEQLKYFIRGYFSADGTARKYEVSCTSQSKELLEDLQSLLLRFDIISRINPHKREDKCIDMQISSAKNLINFKEIGFLQERKNNIIFEACKRKAHHSVSDVIPLTENSLEYINGIKPICNNYFKGLNNIGRDFLQNILSMNKKGSLNLKETNHSRLKKIAYSDIFWDKVISIKKLRKAKRMVYDISVPDYEKFIGSNIILHNTKELNLEHENWLPSVARAGIGLATITGQKMGEVTMFDLLKESFRQRPDYVIVGEIRGVEAFVLFQGMASGHPSMGTMHADSVPTMIKRLETPPINLSPALVETMDAVCVMIQTKIKGEETRKVSQINEIIEVGEGGKARINTPFIWDPRTNRFIFKTKSYVFTKIATHYGLTEEKIYNEFKLRTLLITRLLQNNIAEFKQVQKIIHEYYKSPVAVLKRYKII